MVARGLTRREFSLVVNALAVLISESVTDYVRKKAAILILRHYLPNWREIVVDSAIAPLSRHDERVMKWKNDVMARDGHKCVCCGSTENVEAHHVIPWSDYPGGRIDVNNGMTLCNGCHAKMHVNEEQLILNRFGKT